MTAGRTVVLHLHLPATTSLTPPTTNGSGLRHLFHSQEPSIVLIDSGPLIKSIIIADKRFSTIGSGNCLKIPDENSISYL